MLSGEKLENKNILRKCPLDMEVPLNYNEQNGGFAMKKVIFTVTVVLLLVAFGVSAFLVGSYLIESKEQKDKYDDLASQVESARGTTAATEPSQTTNPSGNTKPSKPAATEPSMIPEYKEIYEKNSDTVGWLRIDGTKINYPVVQHQGLDEKGQEFYLYRDFDKKDSKAGTIFVKDNVDVNEPSDNIVLYGHNMANGSMFAALNAYTNKAAWERNSLIFFDTLNEYHTYKIFAVFKTSANLGEGFAYHNFVDAKDEAEFDAFIAEAKNLSFYDTGITPKYGDKIIMLSTCEYTLDNGRLVVAAYRIS